MHLFKNFKLSTPKLLIYLFLMGFFFFGCEKDDIYNQENINTSQTNEKGYTVKKVTLNEVKQSSLIKNSLDKIKSQFDFNKLNTSKKSSNNITSAVAGNGPIKSKDNTFTILTDEILQVSTDSTQVYTFRIETPTKPESDFENFVIHKNSNGSIVYYIYRYKNLDADLAGLNFSREKVSEDQINIGDFNDYIPSVMFYDATNDCWINVTSEGGVLIIDVSDCDSSGGGGSSGSSGGGSYSGGWNYFNPDGNTSNGCIRTRAYVDSNGNTQIDTEYGVPCPNSSSNDNGSSSDADSTDPWANSSDTWSNTDTLHNGNNSGGGSSPSNDSNTDGGNINDGDIVAILPPTPLEREIDAFFDDLTDEQDDCLASGFNQFKNEITNFFESNQTIYPIGYDGILIDSNLKDFANAAIEAYCDDGEVDFENEIIKDKSFIGTKADCVLKALIASGNNLFKRTSQAFTDGKSKFKLRFTVEKLSRGGVPAQTPMPDENGVIVIKFDDDYVNNTPAIELAQIILHEAIHAELHRIKLTNNAPPNSLPVTNDKYNWYINMWKYYEGIYNDPNYVATLAEHFYMAKHFVDPITKSLREFDELTHPLLNYKGLAWDGLEAYGIQQKYISQDEIDDLIDLFEIVKNDSHENKCD